MNVYIGLITVGVMGVGVAAYLPLMIPSQVLSLITVVFASVFTLLITFMVTKRWMEEFYDQRIQKLEDENERRIRRLKREHDTTTLEKTIRDGTQTLIKNALDYFKIENIKNEIGTSAAIENLQLDKYGQIIELLADFSLILPDIKENKKIVEDEITHQIKIYQIDENPFALFLERIMQKYTVTVNKKIREKIEQEIMESMKTCPQCAEKVLPKAKICRHCGYRFVRAVEAPEEVNPITLDRIAAGKRLYKAGRYEEAIKEFDAAIESKTDEALAYYNRAIAHSRLGNRPQAEADLREASERGHKKAQQLLNRKLRSEPTEEL
jgi:tetratricopeptide (TPR) repeat protein